MTTIRDYIERPFWKNIYNLGNEANANPHFASYVYEPPGPHLPVWLEGNTSYAVRMNRSSQLYQSYDTGSTLYKNDPAALVAFETCSDQTGNPIACADRIFDQPGELGYTRYKRMGKL